MDLLKALASEHSKAKTTRIIKWIGADQSRLDELVRLFLGNDRVISQRAGWPLSYVVEKHPALVQKHLRAILKNLRQPNLHEAVKRNTVRILQFVDVPKALQGEVLNTCFDYITDPKEKPAIKAFSMTVVDNLSKSFPDINNELRLVIETQWDNETAAFRARAKKILKRMKSIPNQ